MRTADMVPVLEKMDQVGYHSLEVWGGATFDVCLRYLGEDPWERLRTIKKHVRRTPLQMLLRGQSLVGYQHYPDDVVEAFIARAVENGVDIIRIFDALNDLRNFEVPVRAAKKAGAHVQAAVVYTVSPVHTTAHYLEVAGQLAQMGADSICIKDMAGLLSPHAAFELVRLLKERINLPVQLHSHFVGGLALAAYLKAAEAGVDVVDTASLPLAFGASQPPVETVVRALQDTPYDTGLDLALLFEIAAYFEDLRKTLGFSRGVTRLTDMQVFEHQVPGGMISNLVNQLEEQKALARLPEVLAEIPRVRAELGYPPLVTPTSQIVGIQSVLNVLSGERYKLVPGEVRTYAQGLYGRPPAPLDPAVAARILGEKKPIDCRPADLMPPKMDKIRDEIKGLAESEEDVLSYALFPQVAKKFLENRRRSGGDSAGNVSSPAGGSGGAEAGFEEGERMNLQEIKELIRLIDQTAITELSLDSGGVKVAIRKGGGGKGISPGEGPVFAMPEQEDAGAAEPTARKTAGAELVPVKSPVVGTFYSAPAPGEPPYVQVGDYVEKGAVLCIIEAMKLMNEIKAEVAGEIAEVLVENGEPVEYGQDLFLIRVR
jgi:oxaloacetate decarboxylase alpha subunit